jgi:hypothetical protein
MSAIEGKVLPLSSAVTVQAVRLGNSVAARR